MSVSNHFVRYHLMKISSGLSVFGSSVVLAEIIDDFLSDSERGRVPSVTRILFSVSIGDILASFAWFLGTWVSPRHLDYLDGTNHGSYETCRMQGFILTVGGLAAVLFYSFLAIFYLLMIAYNWRESRLEPLQRKIQYAIWITVVGVAIIPLVTDSYHNSDELCSINSYPYGCTESWQLDDSTNETTDCTAGDNAGFYRRIITMGFAFISLSCSFIILGVLYRKLRILGKQQSQVVAKRQSRQQRASSITASHTYADVTPSHIDDPQQQIRNNDHDDYDDVEVDADDVEIQQHQQQSSRRVSTLEIGLRIFAFEGMMYMIGFIVLFLPWIASVIVYMTTGSWNHKLEAAAMFFGGLQGFYNMFVFTTVRRQEMKTALGKAVKHMIYFVVDYRVDFSCGCKASCRKRNDNNNNDNNNNNNNNAQQQQQRQQRGAVQQGNNKIQKLTPHQQQASNERQQQQQQQGYYVNVNWKETSCVSELTGFRGVSQVEDNNDEFSIIPVAEPTTSAAAAAAAAAGNHHTSSCSKMTRQQQQQQQQQRTDNSKDAIPSRPIRTMTEVSGLESIDELSELTPDTHHDYDPAAATSAIKAARSGRFDTNEMIEMIPEGHEPTGDDVSDHSSSSSDLTPRKPMRSDSATRTIQKMKDCYATSDTSGDPSPPASITGGSDVSPHQPNRCESEVESIVLMERDPQGSSSDLLPHQPMRFESEVETPSDDDDDETFEKSEQAAAETTTTGNKRQQLLLSTSYHTNGGSTASSDKSLSLDSQQRHPCRVKSEVEGNDDASLSSPPPAPLASTTASLSDSLPQLPNRWESEVEATSECSYEYSCEVSV